MANAMTQFILVRPGSTDYDQQGRIQGNLDIPLNEQGNSEVAKAIDELKHQGIQILYCCGCSAARQTAEALSTALGVKLKEMDNMQNLNHGLWQGMLIDEVRRRQPTVYRQWQEQPECVRPPGGETIGEARERVRAALAKISRKHKDDVVGLIVPEPLASMVRSQLRSDELGDLWRATQDHGHWELIDMAPVPAR
jgi:broad specificity phosphatase PhoE